MNRIRLKVMSVIVLTALCLGVSNAQESKMFTMLPMGDEAFSVIREVFEYDPTLPLDARIVGQEKRDGYIREKVSFNGILGERVPAYLAIPADKPGPFPCIIMLHGLSVSKDIWWEAENDHSGLLLTEGLLSRGYAVLTADDWYHGERMIRNDYENPMTLLWNPDTHNRFRRMLTNSTVDMRRALDYLETRQEIDMTRIGAIGYSMGGIMTFQLAALDERVRVGISCVGPHRIPNTLLDVFSAYQFAPRIDKPFMVLMGRKDTRLYTVADAERLHELIASPMSELKLYDSGHRLPSSYTADAIGWFEKHLK